MIRRQLMRRSGSLKRTPLKRSGKLKPVSDKRAPEQRRYLNLRGEFLTEHPHCEFHGCHNRSRDVHHVKGRGKFLLDTESFLALCRMHHDEIHQNPKAARAAGYLK